VTTPNPSTPTPDDERFEAGLAALLTQIEIGVRLARWLRERERADLPTGRDSVYDAVTTLPARLVDHLADLEPDDAHAVIDAAVDRACLLGLARVHTGPFGPDADVIHQTTIRCGRCPGGLRGRG